MLYDVLVIGAGQAGLAAGYYLQQAGLVFAILDGQTEPGRACPYSIPASCLTHPRATRLCRVLSVLAMRRCLLKTINLLVRRSGALSARKLAAATDHPAAR